MLRSTHRPRRTTAACVACRRSKIKCSGESPCNNCRRRATTCLFATAETKVLVSERYLRDLQNRARGRRTGGGENHPGASEVAQEDPPIQKDDPRQRSGSRGPWHREDSPSAEPTLSSWTSPFTLPTTIIKNGGTTKRNWLWLAPTSPWSFVVRLAVMMSEKLRMSSCKIMKFHLDGDVYPLDWWESVPTKAPFDISTLPSIDHAMHALHNVKFHLGHICRFLRDDLAAQIREFYDSRGAPGAGQSRMWFIKFLLVLAFGKAFSSRTKSHGAPPGSSWFLRAMSLMPNHTSTGQDSLAVIENLALAALYLYAIDHRERAHSHVGQAIRIAQLEGLHTQLPEDELGYLTVRRCRSLWWSLYILDRQISSSLGLPMTVKDIDITALVDPPGAIPEDPTLSLQVRLSQMMSSILSEVYRTDKTQLGPFLEVTRGILQAMASLAEEIEKIFPAGFHASLDIMPHDLRYIILLYHQCVITATRPLLLSVLQARLGKLGRAEEEWHEAVALPKSLLSTGIRSAVKTLEILSDENIVLEKFLPSDLEFAFWAALHLMIARTLFHLDPTEAAPSNAGLSILDEIISSGNRVAEVRRTELTYIQSLFDNLATRTEEEGLHIRALSKVNEADPGTRVGVASEGQPQTSQTDHMTLAWPVWPDTNISSSAWAGESLSGTLDSLDLIGISSQEFLSIVDQIGQQGYTS